MNGLTQQNRLASIQTPLGEDTLYLKSMEGVEELGRLFSFEVELLSEDFSINFDKIIGEKATVKLRLPQGQTRHFSGYVSHFRQAPAQGSYARYHATIVPWLWFLTHTADCRIFQNQTAPEIIEEVFKKHKAFSDFKLPSGRYRKRTYCVQYRETDFEFVSRLMEQEGIYYSFEHGDQAHKLVLAEKPGDHQPYPGYDKIEYHAAAGTVQETEHIFDLSLNKQLRSGRHVNRDFNFTKPKADLQGRAEIQRSHAHPGFEVFDYPGQHEAKDEGNTYAKVRIEELQAQHEFLRGEADARGIAPGYKFTLKEFERADQNREYLVCSAHYSIHVELPEAAGSGATADGPPFLCAFSVIPADVTFRPQRLTPKPIVRGPQTAIVVGPQGEEIYTDPDGYGQVKVQFHWDRYGERNEKSSCWVRVAQTWAGAKWGSIHIPRIGQEVIVDFLEGDPDRPIITGRVYNGDSMPPYALPANKTQSGIKSRSSKGGGSDNFNEVRFEDKKGEEQLSIHAEKNQDNVVENDETTSVGHDRTEDVGHDEKITVGNDRTEKVGNNESITIGVNRTENVGSNETIGIGQNRNETVGANESISVAQNRTRSVGQNETINIAVNRSRTVGVNDAITVGAAQEITVGAAQAITVGAAQAITVGAAQAITVGAAQAISVGADQATTVAKNQANSIGQNRQSTIGKDDSLTVAKKLTINAGDEILIQTGKASISMKKDGTIHIAGKDITVEGKGEINATAKKDFTMKGKKILQN